MALHRLPAEVDVPYRMLLENSHRVLRTANEQLRVVEHEICFLKAAKRAFFKGHTDSALDSLDRKVFETEKLTPIKPYWSDWVHRAHQTGLLDSLDNLDSSLERQRALKTEYEAVQNTLRCAINEQSRLYLRNLSILDFPDEILLGIFELLEPPCNPIIGYCGNRADIKNTRLVCRRFCDVSSQLLVRLVHVGVNEPSLARLEEISRHPTIAKGVRTIRLVLHLHNNSFSDFDLFISYHADEVEEQVDMWDRAKLWDCSGPKMDEQTAAEVTANGMAVVSTLRRLAWADPDDVEMSEVDKNHRACLDETHREYLALLETQESLISSGEFSRIVGFAMSRMPGARRLEVTDSNFFSMRGHGVMSGGDIWAAAHHRMLQPMTAYQMEKHDLERPNYQCLLDTLRSVQGAGVLLDAIDIDLSTMGIPGALVLAPDLRQEFCSGMRLLKEFKFRYSEALDEEGADHLSEFLSACLETSSLRQIFLSVGATEEGEGARIDVGRIVGSKSQLTDISIHGQFATDLSKLVRLLEQLPEPVRVLSLDGIRLLSGTWEEALVAIRKKKCQVMFLSDPCGAECDDMSSGDYERIFSRPKDSMERNAAEVYVRSHPALRIPNPLRAL
ncbi:hypothetical protein N658DRAFT_305749 [Parathielavia hyrcaniae]|uniref:F-box domain-containing protein n=1 Tax=Parathielavia hyrcaniae TaxID=113614 RepID=A0AAN6Q5G3_9PEZI|nr:hypothetical protein N658DRAFT_305749 [Parathielavia hyrcaniae]